MVCFLSILNLLAKTTFDISSQKLFIEMIQLILLHYLMKTFLSSANNTSYEDHEGNR